MPKRKKPRKLPRTPSANTIRWHGMDLYDAFPRASSARLYARLWRRTCPETGGSGRAVAADLGSRAGRLRYAVYIRCSRA